MVADCKGDYLVHMLPSPQAREMSLNEVQENPAFLRDIAKHY